MRTTYLVYFLLFSCFTSTHAQLTLTAEIRPRAEFRNGFKTLKSENTDPAFFVEQRTRIYLDYRNERLRLYAALQDVRIWGNVDQIYKGDPALTNFYEAWGEYNLDQRFYFRVGRQAWDYNNARFLGNLEWAQQGRSHDGFLFHCRNPELGTQLHIGAAYNQNVAFEPTQLSGTAYFGVNNYKTVQFAWWRKQWDADNSLSLLIHNDGRQVASDTSMAYRQTYAAIGNMRLGSIALGGELYFQGGRNAGDTRVRGLLAALHATVQTGITPLTLGFDYLSGTARGEDTDRSFAPLYGTNHKFYGFMDYFYVGNFHGQASTPSGLVDMYAKSNLRVTDRSSLLVHVHAFSSPVTIYEAPASEATVNRYLGTEADLVYNLQLLENLKINIGYSHMFAAKGMESVKGVSGKGPVQNWVWAMVAFKPQLLETNLHKTPE